MITKELGERLIEGYRSSAAMDQSLAEEWHPLEEEAWNKHVEPGGEEEDSQ
jgi:hypothetical protein